ncbi:hypothetical protein QGM71_17485 [Virgibacillus sp. C22-A2]|uniref:Uncharacterized protein n=1 Tax=Virgibacillus tibetensis TaxID=3042313 RepID=A0ABU6KIX6_9BACI|nr:hypothetical protein [Virgibacillus sp. C22-A2]
MKKMVNIMVVSTLLMGSYFLLEKSNDMIFYGTIVIEANNEDHPEY